MKLLIVKKIRWQEDTEELQKNGHNDQDNHGNVVRPLELDILECEVKWFLASIATNKASGGDRILAELFNSLQDKAVKIMH